MKELFAKNDILLFTETWSNKLYDYSVDGFHSYILNRSVKLKGSKRDSGGIIIFISDQLKNDVEFLKNTDDCFIWVKLKGNLFKSKSDVLL